MSTPEAAPPQHEPLRGGAASLPPVTPPTGTFILQLFLIPLLIVSIVVALWLMFSWVAHMGRDNAVDLAAAIERGDTSSWQRAYELAELLRSPDPRYDPIRRDAALAKGLSKFLERDLAQPLPPGGMSEEDKSPSGKTSKVTYSTRQAPPLSDRRKQVMQRMYLCRALGEFYIPDGLPILLKAAMQETDPVEVQVRFAAMEAIATLGDHCGPETLRANAELLETLLTASRTTDTDDPPAVESKDGTPSLYRPHAELRAVAAYALGVIGGEQGTERLAQMLHDAYPNARYNAATGLARAGDVRSLNVLREMLDPDNELAVKDELNPNDQARKKTTVLLNGVKATLHLAQANPMADLSQLKAALEKLTTSPLENVLIERNKVKAAATEALRRIEK